MKALIALLAAFAFSRLLHALLAARVEMSHTPVVNLPSVQSQTVQNGSIYQAASYRPLFEDYPRPSGGRHAHGQHRREGVRHPDQHQRGCPSPAAWRPASPPAGHCAQQLCARSAAASSDNTNKGKGSNQNTNDFSGTITAVVTAVLPNGHLMISGEADWRQSQRGRVALLRPGGPAPSAPAMGALGLGGQCAHRAARRGDVSNAHAVGWLSRFFLNLAPS